jgi:hypothetical protein
METFTEIRKEGEFEGGYVAAEQRIHRSVK